VRAELAEAVSHTRVGSGRGRSPGRLALVVLAGLLVPLFLAFSQQEAAATPITVPGWADFTLWEIDMLPESLAGAGVVETTAAAGVAGSPETAGASLLVAGLIIGGYLVYTNRDHIATWYDGLTNGSSSSQPFGPPANIPAGDRVTFGPNSVPESHEGFCYSPGDTCQGSLANYDAQHGIEITLNLAHVQGTTGQTGLTFAGNELCLNGDGSLQSIPYGFTLYVQTLDPATAVLHASYEFWNECDTARDQRARLLAVDAWTVGHFQTQGPDPVCSDCAAAISRHWLLPGTTTTTPSSLRTVHAVVECDGPGTQVHSVVGPSKVYLPGTRPQVIIPRCVDTYPGSYDQKIQIVTEPDGQVLWQQVLTPQFDAWQLCRLNACHLALDRTTNADGSVSWCGDGIAGCDAFLDPSQLYTFHCWWGYAGDTHAYAMPLRDCQAAGMHFAPAITTNPSPSAAPSPSLQPSPSVGPSPGVSPGAGGGGGSGGPAPDPVVGQTGDCYPSGWAAFNPVEWVLKPVECALRWAFVPDPVALEYDVLALRQTRIFQSAQQAQWTITDPLYSLGNIGQGASGCEGPALTITPLHLVAWHPLNACDPPMSTVAHVVNILLTLTVYVGGAVVAGRAILNALGYSLPFGGGESDS
jgi:hypothetical protein